MSTYVPDPEVVQQNEAYGFALHCAPNVLYARYKQYGQVRHVYAMARGALLNKSTSWACWPGVPSLVN
jgi:hypothetical protein